MFWHFTQTFTAPAPWMAVFPCEAKKSHEGAKVPYLLLLPYCRALYCIIISEQEMLPRAKPTNFPNHLILFKFPHALWPELTKMKRTKFPALRPIAAQFTRDERSSLLRLFERFLSRKVPMAPSGGLIFLLLWFPALTQLYRGVAAGSLSIEGKWSGALIEFLKRKWMGMKIIRQF